MPYTGNCIVGSNPTLSATQSGHLRTGLQCPQKVAEALVVASLTGRHTITSRKHEKTFEEAIREAFFAVDIELKKIRGKRATHEVRIEPVPPLRGVIMKLFRDEGYGFILQDGGG